LGDFYIEIETIKYSFEGHNIGTSGFVPAKSPESVFEIGQLESNKTKLVKIDRYKHPSGVLKIMSQDTIEQIIEFRCLISKFQPCVIHKEISADI